MRDWRPRLRGMRWRLACGVAGAVLSLTLASSAAPAPIRLPSVQPPALPTPEGPAPVSSSFVGARISIPLGPLRQALEAALPLALRAPDVEERVTPEEILQEEKEANEESEAATAEIYWRGPIHRGPIRFGARRDTLYASTQVSYAVEARGEGFGATSCGTPSFPLTGEVRIASRLGWSGGWSLEARSRQLPTVYGTRCKPRPPGVNFTKLVNDRVERLLSTRLGPTFDSLASGLDASTPISAFHAALGRPIPLGTNGPWLLWHPGQVRAEWPRVQGDSLVLDLAVETRPEIQLEPDSVRALLPPAPELRLFGSDVRIPFDCWTDLNLLGGRLLGLVTAYGPSGDSLRVTSARLRGANDRLVVELLIGGALDGRLFLSGTLRCSPPDFVLEEPDLD